MALTTLIVMKALVRGPFTGRGSAEAMVRVHVRVTVSGTVTGGLISTYVHTQGTVVRHTIQWVWVEAARE